MRYHRLAPLILIAAATAMSVGQADAQSVTSVAAMQGLAPFTTLLASPQGRAALAANFLHTGAIQNGTYNQPVLLPFADQQHQALRDAFITGRNATNVADGLGSTLGAIYQAKDVYANHHDFTVIAPSVGNLIQAANQTPGSDANAVKFGAAGATSAPGVPWPAARAIIDAAGGTTDVYGKAYHSSADPNGNPRPFQTEPNITFFHAKDYFGHESGNKDWLEGKDGDFTQSPAYPSGHTTYGWTSSLLFGLMVPERFQEMVTRAAEYGNDRIIMGAHYTTDVLGGRTLALYDMAQMLSGNPDYFPGAAGVQTAQGALAQATSDLRRILGEACGASIATCAAADTSRFSDRAANKTFYDTTQTYGLPVVHPNAAAVEDVNAKAPEAGYLLQSRFPYLTLQQRNDILTTTEGPGGGFLDDGSAFGLYSRLDLFKAADGYGAFDGQTTINLNAALGGFNAADTYRNDIAGAGGLTLTGTGRLTLAGHNTYAGPTIVDGATLEIAGSIVSPTSIERYGTLAGAGSTGDVRVDRHGVLAPGASGAQAALLSGMTNVAGTRLAVDGNLRFAPGSKLAIFATSRQATSVAATGAATIDGGRVRVQTPGGRISLTKDYTILAAAGGVIGRFASAHASLPFLKPLLTYAPTGITLSFAPDRQALVGSAGTANQRAVASGLANAARAGSAANPLLDAIVRLRNGAQARAAFDSLSGEGIAASQNVAFRSAQLFNSTIFDQTTFYGGGAANSVTLTESQPAFVALAAAQGQPIRELADLPASRVAPANMPAARTWRAWATGFGATETIHSDTATGAARQNDTLYGGTLGVDYQLLPNDLIGVALGGSDGSFRVGDRGTSGSTTGGHVAVYDILTLGQWYGATSTSFSYFTNRTTRMIAGFGGLAGETERGTFDSHEFRNRLEIGRLFDGFGGALTPFAALEIAELRSNGFAETAMSGPGRFRLIVDGQSLASVPSFVGFRLQRVTPFGNGMVLSPTLQVAWVHEFAPVRSQTVQLASLPGAVFLTDGARPARDSAQVKAGGELSIGARAAFFTNFEGEFSGVHQLYAGKGGFRYVW